MSALELAAWERWAVRDGDSLQRMCELPANSVDALISDSPYSSGGMMRSDRTAPPTVKYVRGSTRALPSFSGDNRDQRSFLTWSVMWMSEAWRVARTGAVFALFSDWRMLPTMTDAVQAAGWVWRGIVPWHKPVARPQPGRFRQSTEFVLWGSKGPMPARAGVYLPGLVAAAPVPRARRFHPTEKPVSVMRELVSIVEPGHVVLDPFAGAGSTGVACVLENRRFLGLELEPTYAGIARRRIAEAERDAKHEVTA